MPVTKKNGSYQQGFSRGNDIEIVHNFIYLGSDIDANISCVSEMRRRFVLAGGVGIDFVCQSSNDMM